MVSREYFLHDLSGKLLHKHEGSILRIAGIGSFFFNNQREEYKPEQDRTADLHLIVDNLEKFYSGFEPEKYGFSNKVDVENLVTINEHIPSYYLSSDESYRITVTPFDKFEPWTSQCSEIGHFLAGRYQKPMTEIFEDKDSQSRLLSALDKIYNSGVDLSMKTMPAGEYSVEEVIENIFLLSYVAEGPRSMEARRKGKHRVYLDKMRDESMQLYAPRIEEKEGYADGKVIVPEDGAENLKQFKEWALPRFAYVVSLLSMINENPETYAQKKIVRSCGLPENPILLNLAKPIVAGLNW